MSKLSILAAAAVAAMLGSAPAGAQTVLTASSWVPPNHPLTANGLVAWTKEVEQATAGRVKFTILPKAPVAPPQTFDAVKDGVVDPGFDREGHGRRTLRPLPCPRHPTFRGRRPVDQP